MTVDKKGTWYFKLLDLFRLSLNNNSVIEAGSIKRTSKNKLKANILFTPVELVEQKVDEAFERFSRNTPDWISDAVYVYEVLRLERTLMTIHPFNNGNGRAIRVLSTLLYLKRDIPPPLIAMSNDYLASLGEHYRFTIKMMNQQLKARSMDEGQASGVVK